MSKHSVPQLTPGSKLYKCLDYNQVICKGKEETFLIEIKRLSDDQYKNLTKGNTSATLGPRAE